MALTSQGRLQGQDTDHFLGVWINLPWKQTQIHVHGHLGGFKKSIVLSCIKPLLGVEVSELLVVLICRGCCWHPFQNPKLPLQTHSPYTPALAGGGFTGWRVIMGRLRTGEKSLSYMEVPEGRSLAPKHLELVLRHCLPLALGALRPEMLLRGGKQRYQVTVTPSHLCQDWKWGWEYVLTVTASAQKGINTLFLIQVKEKKSMV